MFEKKELLTIQEFIETLRYYADHASADVFSYDETYVVKFLNNFQPKEYLSLYLKCFIESCGQYEHFIIHLLRLISENRDTLTLDKSFFQDLLYYCLTNRLSSNIMLECQDIVLKGSFKCPIV